MSYSEPLINQPRVLLLSVGVGVILGVVYVIIQSLCRLLGEGRLSYYVADSLFSLIFALVSFFFMVNYAGGRIRLHLILGEGAGFFAFYYSVGAYLYSLTLKVIRRIRRIAEFLLKPLVRLVAIIKEACKRLKSKMTAIFKKENIQAEAPEKKKKKFNLFGKIHLKNPYKSV